MPSMPSVVTLSDMAFDMEFATLEAREASFAPPTKRSKTGGWPHKTPKPADLARAGFYFKPSAHSNDNAVCFMCSRNLDGWEKDDDPVEEHLKHAEDCGWAVMMNIELQKQTDTSNMEDPTSEKIAEARHATFAVGWPHESKRGWTCKVEKMVEGGWHFAPTTESEDYVSCAYCKLSLDGWEPKDSPFDEHYSRSPDCPFFVFAGTTAPSKRPKAKRGRASRTSKVSRASTRLSTQSNVTFETEANEIDIPDLDESLDTSNMSIMSTASTATTKGKGKRTAAASKAKTTKAKKAKTTKSKKKEPESEVGAEPEPEMEVEEATQPSQAEEIAYPTLEETTTIGAPAEKPKPRAKRGKAKKEKEPEPEPEPEPEIEVDIEAEMEIEPITEAPLSPVESLGPPEREASMIPILPISPVPAVSAHKHVTTTTQRPSSQQPQSQTTPTKPSTLDPVSPSPPPSDIENAPPSTRPESTRPPLPPLSPSPHHHSSSSSLRHQSGSTFKWTPIDTDLIFEFLSSSNPGLPSSNTLSELERQMTVQDFIKSLAIKAEEDLRMEGERTVNIFEREGQKALRVLEGIVCS